MKYFAFTLIATVCVENAQASKMSKAKSAVKFVGKAAKIVVADGLMDKVLSPIVPGGAPVILAAKTIASVVKDRKQANDANLMSPGIKDFAKDLIKDEISEHKADIKDLVVKEIESIVKEKAGEVITDKLSD